MSIIDWDELKGSTDLDVGELLDVPFFQETLTTKATTKSIQTVEDLKYLFLYVIFQQRSFPKLMFLNRKWFPDPLTKVHAAVFSSNAEVVVCLSFPSSGSHIYSLFDSHARPDHRDGPALTFSSHLDDITKRLHNVLLQSTTRSNSPSKNPNLCALLLGLKEGQNSDIRDVLARSATYLSRKQMGINDTAASSFFGSEHISLLRLRAESLRNIRSQEFLDSDALSDSLPQIGHKKEHKSAVGPRRNGEFGWQLSLLLESNSIPSIVISDADGDTEKQDEASTSSSPSSRLDVAIANEGNDLLMPSHRRSEYSWLTSLARESTYTVWPSPENSVKEFASHQEAESLLEKEDTWEAALIQQLQEEEEISASLSHHVSSEHAWLVTLQKRLQEGDNLKSNTVAPSTLLRSELDWQLAVQLQQEAFRDENDETVPENVSDVGESEIEDSLITNKRRLSRNHLQVPSWRRSEDTSTFGTLDLPRQNTQPSFECGICAEMHHPREKISLSDCDHKFCNECLSTFTKTKIEEGRYPIFCPECLAQRMRTSKSRK